MKKALIAMSGGVDSSVAAKIMMDNGYECMGAIMRLNCSGTEEEKARIENSVQDAEAVANNLKMPFYSPDFSDDFKKEVVSRFISSYETGYTPNPCVVCNKYLKFGKFYEYARNLGADKLVTGHYAIVEEKEGQYFLKKAKDITKDQSYVLFSLTQEILAHIYFPLGEMTKKNAREIAEKNGFITAHKSDSQDICFVPDGDYARFIEEYANKKYKKGKFVDLKGNVLGEHKGIIRYTIGQRKGLGLSLPAPMYVYDKDIKGNRVILCSNDELFSSTLYVSEFNWISGVAPKEEIYANVKIRYNQKEQPAKIKVVEDGRVFVEFDTPQRAIAKGQAAVVYDGDYVLGGGIIE